MQPSSLSRKRGFTLLEILVVSAIAAILVVTAASLLVTMSSQRAANRKRLDRLTQSFTAMTLLERSLLNGGYHFPSARFGFRVYDNVVSGATYAGYAVGAPCGGSGCIVPNTDVLELVEGVSAQPGQLNTWLTDGGIQMFHPAAPLDFYDAGTGQFLFMFGTSDGGNCIAVGRPIDPAVAPDTVNVGMVDRNLAAVALNYYSVATAPAYYQCPPAMGTPSTFDWTVSVASVRHVYLVLATDAGVYGLYQKDLSPLVTATSGSSDAGLIVLARGVDNFQVVPLIQQGNSTYVSGCSNGICECNSGFSCSLSGANDNQNFADTARVVGVRIGLTARGETQDRGTGTAVVPPRLANETMPAETPPLKRTTQTQTYMMRNFAQVQP
jgi:prepilin-type N-terminal cleavage/methylation domain-containing protein